MANQGSRTGPGTGWLFFAAVMIFIVGCHNIIYGIATLDDYAVIVNNLTGDTEIIYADTDFWGWLWICVGIVQVITAFGILARNQIARWVGVAIATINAIGQLAFLAAFPVWSIVIIAIDVLVIYGLLTYDEPYRRAYEPYPSDEATRAARARAGSGYGAQSPADTTTRTTGASTSPRQQPPAY